MRRAETVDELQRAVQPVFAALGYPWFAAASFFNAERKPLTRVLLGHFHPEWAERYTSRNYSSQSQISQELLNCSSPYSWSEVIKRREIRPSQRRIWDEAREFGITDGLFVPVSWGNGSYSAVVLGGTRPPVDDPAHRTMAEVVAAYYGQHGRRLCGKQRPNRSLSPRQRDCLTWVALGKSSMDIGEILGISVETVNEYVAGACSKLGVRTRTQAVLEAIWSGQIRP